MLRKNSSWLLLALAALLWLLAAWGAHREAKGRQPRGAAELITAQLRRMDEAVQQLGRNPSVLRAWMQGSGSSETARRLSNQPFFLFAFQGDSLSAWNTTTLSPSAPFDSVGRLVRVGGTSGYGFQWHRSWMPKGSSISVLLPIARQFPYNNEYLQSGFSGARFIDPQLILSDSAVADAAPILAPNGKAIAWLAPAAAGNLPMPPATWIVWCWLCSLVLLALWLHRWLSLSARRTGLVWSTMILLALALGIRALLMVFGPPFHIAESELFSPRLYASSVSLSSLGELLLHVLTCLWVVSFLSPRLRISAKQIPARLRFPLAVALSVGLLASGLLFLKLLRSLVLDSLIPFDRAHLSAFDSNALTGIIVVMLLLSIQLQLLTMVRRLVWTMLPALRGRVVAIIAGTVLLWLLAGIGLPEPMYFLVPGWLLLELLLKGHEQVHRDLPGVRRIFWAIAHCALLSLVLLTYTRQREASARRHFAEHIAARHDDAMEYNFGKTFPSLRSDTALLRFLKSPTVAGRKALDDRLATLYLNDLMGAYQARIYLFDRDGTPLDNPDSTSLADLEKAREQAIPSRTAQGLYYRDPGTDDHLYLVLAPISDSFGDPIGVLGADLEQKKIVSETVLPELLQPGTVNQAEKAAGYSYAIYSSGRLVAQTSDYPFPYYILRDTVHIGFQERKANDASLLIYTPDAFRSVYVWRSFNTLSEGLTLLSYLLLFRFLMLALIWAYRYRQMWMRRPAELLRGFKGKGLRRRLQLSIMGVVALSFALVGIVTIYFLRQRYDDNEKDRRQAMMQLVSRSIQQWMTEQGGDESAALWSQKAQSNEFGYFLTQLASAQKIDINVFDAQGRLANTTQPAVYAQNLLAPFMRYYVLNALRRQPRSLLTEIEQIGSLRYQSCYTPFRMEGGAPAGYLNVPLFYAQRELDEQISNIIVTLINLYAAALLLSALLAYFFSRWMMRAFDLIIRQFGRLSLHRNEPLQWPYDDEIGVLVAEYNKMAKKVEESVAVLARSERESAFREMARQVAHEIKNPLTPMSLYVQRLQRALAANEPDVLALAKRVSEALLEQISSLSVIATEFSEYARMTPAKAENIDLTALVRNVAEPFAAQENLHLQFDLPNHLVSIRADRGQMVRVLTNLVKNAAQAIPEGRQGEIAFHLREEGGMVVLLVRDNGSGISPEAQEKMFTPYFTTKSSGTGLGLAMTRQMLESWGGSISYETQAGEGTTFTVKLPLNGATPTL